MRPEFGWIPAAIVALALALRLFLPGLKPPHFDEGVNGWFVDEMTKQGFYHYDPGNFHGPLHFYLLFVSQTLFGRHVWALRLPVALISAGCVALVFAFRSYLSERACQLTAMAFAVSPGMVFYGRDAIHESELVFFAILAVWGGAGWLRAASDPESLDLPEARPRRTRSTGASPLWALFLGLTGMILTKETYIIHFAALLLAFPALWALEKFSPSAPSQFGWIPLRIDQEPAANAFLCSCLTILFFYSGGLLDWSSLPGLWTTFAKWRATGTGGESGHEKPWYYWLELLVRYEWIALIGLAGIVLLLRARNDRFIRYLAISGAATLAIYSGISYKTPWCILSIGWPFFFVFGSVADRAATRFDRKIWGPALALLFGATFFWTLRLNLWRCTDEDEPYVYVQTTTDIRRLLEPLRWLTASDPVNFHVPGHVLVSIEDSHPLPWLLGDFTRVDYLDAQHPPAAMDAAFLVLDDSMVSDTEDRLTEAYFKESFLLRGNSGQFVTVYLRASTFAAFFPGRSPEFHPEKLADPDRKTEEEK